MAPDPHPPFEHHVQFYSTEDQYLQTLIQYFQQGLDNKEKCLVVATAPHRKALRTELEALGYDISWAEATGSYIEMDATQTLSHFMKDGKIDNNSFNQVIGSLVPHIARTPIRAFGEMVVLLWQAGNSDSAILLEELWNKLGGIRQFKLLCAYPDYVFEPINLKSEKHRITEQHSHLVPLLSI